jgi:hypothetical protein
MRDQLWRLGFDQDAAALAEFETALTALVVMAAVVTLRSAAALARLKAAKGEEAQGRADPPPAADRPEAPRRRSEAAGRRMPNRRRFGHVTLH